MSNVIHIDFLRREKADPQFEFYDRAPNRDIDPVGFWSHMIKDIESRYRDRMPKNGCVYKQPLRSNIFDSYGWGCVHNSLYQYRPTKDESFNEPFPMPADLPAIEKYLIKKSNKVLKFGDKSDPFMWMDYKYKITKTIIEMANKYNVSLVIYTMSDLCAHTDYLDLLVEGDHSIVMNMGLEASINHDDIEKRISPGAPSLRRRRLAIDKLRDAGISVTETYARLDTVMDLHSKEFSRRTGMWLDGMTEAQAREAIKNYGKNSLGGAL